MDETGGSPDGYNIIKKISSTRAKKGYSYENMASELSMTPASYRKIEIGKTKLTVVRLFQISKILNVLPFELLGIDNDSFQQINNNINSADFQNKFEKLSQENKEISQKVIEDLRDEILQLKSEIEFLRGLVINQNK